jgi:hypothetical protein
MVIKLGAAGPSDLGHFFRGYFLMAQTNDVARRHVLGLVL